ncbi:Leucine carboxyl methyltransferase 1 [Geodia barretti]|uniref:Leucine carboxyl methyltransferase 1 n=1 Tax=Geodia barretti TaxID=519541 RepID=A0AA35SMS6_GEOBA|nr:Leucine carboxyl methyltransferase 1 [Geodia barretti]
MAASVGLPSDDLAVQATNDDATSCKRYAVDRGYWKDEFIRYLYRSSEKKSPEISRGYYARVKSIHILVDQFLDRTQQKCQLVTFGAGSDTLHWLLWKRKKLPALHVEVDFPTVTARKSHCIKTRPVLLEALSNPVITMEAIRSDHYVLLPADLRDVKSLGKQLIDAGLDPNLPTLFLAECVLAYVEGAKVNDVIRWTAEHFKTSVFLNYDPINPFDKFGEIMKQNLKSRGCALLGMETCPDSESQVKRYHDNGWEGAWSMDMAEVYARLPRDDVARIERIDFLDERELLDQLLRHYCLSGAHLDSQQLGAMDDGPTIY